MAEVKWIKITTDIFDDEKILLIESLPDAYAIITVWFKLLCLAGKQNNSGVFMMGRIPYTEKMLATIFRMKEATVSMALQTFEQFGMVEIVDGVITIPNWGKHQNLDQLENKKAYMRNYMKEYRDKQRLLTSGDNSCKSYCKTNSKTNVSQADKDIDKELDKDKELEQEKENLCVPAYVPKINTNQNEVQTLINDCFTMIEEHNQTGKHKVPISKALIYFQQKEGRDILELLKQYEAGEIKTALENYLKVADCDSWKSGFSFNAFFRNISEYTPAFFDISKYIDAPKNKEDVQAITEAFAEKNRKEKWFDYAVLHHHREDWIKAGKPEKEAFEKWADKVYAEDKENGINY